MRAFLAIPLPSDLRRAAAATRSLIAGAGSGWRFSREEGLHLTIRFLGEVEPQRIDALHAVWRAVASEIGPLPLRACGASVFPTTGRPRVLWLALRDGTPDGALARLAARVEQAARAQGFAPEERPFAPHVTLARARRDVRAAHPPLDRVGDLGAFVADRLVLFRSVLDGGGAQYTEIASYPFASGPRP